MDFELTESQVTVRDLAGEVFDRHAEQARLTEVEAGDERCDRRLWRDLATSGVLGLAVPDGYDGSGLSFSDFAPALVEQGRRVCQVPLWETVVLGALPLIRYGDEKQRRHWLPRVAAGDVVLTAALEVLGPDGPSAATVHAAGRDGSWELTGRADSVPGGHLADAVVVPARTGSQTVELFLVDTGQPRATRTSFERTDRGRAVDLVLAGARGERLAAGPAEDRLGWLLRRAWVGLAALQLGVSEESVRRAAEYLSQRHQFGVPLATLQAAAHQAADCRIDTEAMAVTFWDALWRLETGRPAAAAVHTAKWWAASAGDRVARTVQHLHGGIGADVTYPVHRYLLWTSQLATTLGPASWHLHQIGLHVAGGTA